MDKCDVRYMRDGSAEVTMLDPIIVMNPVYFTNIFALLLYLAQMKLQIVKIEYELTTVSNPVVR